MRDYGRVHTAFWTSSDIQALSDDGKLLALYLLTSPHSTIAGAYRLPDAYISDDIGWPSERVSNGFRELIGRGFVTVCRASKWLFLRKFLVWNPPEGPNQWKAVRKIADSIPTSCVFRAEFIEICALLADGKSLPDPSPSGTPSKPIRIQEREREREQEMDMEQEQEGLCANPSATPASSESRDIKKSLQTKSPPPRSRGRKNGAFESINETVGKLLASKVCRSGDIATIAKVAGISEAQARESVRQLGDRGRLP